MVTRRRSTGTARTSCCGFLDAPSPLAFWARRQAHEPAIHRADAESAAGDVTPFPAVFAADGIDELLVCFASRGGVPGPQDQVKGRWAGPRAHLDGRSTNCRSRAAAASRLTSRAHSPRTVWG